MAENKVFEFKLVVLGDVSVGKSSIVLRFVQNEFSEFRDSTIGGAFWTKGVKLNDCIVKFGIWDTAGQEKYHSMVPMYYRGAAAALIVYDITSQESYQRAKLWIKELQKPGTQDVLIVLTGNKVDQHKQRKVTIEEARGYAKEHKFLFMETSAKMNTNIIELFLTIARQLPKSHAHQRRHSFVLDDYANYEIPSRKKSCCSMS